MRIFGLSGDLVVAVSLIKQDARIPAPYLCREAAGVAHVSETLKTYIVHRVELPCPNGHKE
jgi:hypothetical protein